MLTLGEKNNNLCFLLRAEVLLKEYYYSADNFKRMIYFMLVIFTNKNLNFNLEFLKHGMWSNKN